MPDEASAAKTADKLWFYIDEEGARGFGHVGIVFAYSDGSAERFYQSAVNPQDKLWRLVILKQPVKVIRREIQNFRYIYQLIDSKECFCVHTRYGDAVRARVDEYIRKNAPYSTFKYGYGSRAVMKKPVVARVEFTEIAEEEFENLLVKTTGKGRLMKIAATDNGGQDIYQTADAAVSRKRKQQIPVLDLHGNTEAEALGRLDLFMNCCVRRGYLRIRVITGKGYGSPGGVPVIRESVRRLLTDCIPGRVVSFSYTKPADGGSGAFDVRLKSVSANKNRKMH
ncbi:hypothetical protein CHS0354_035249 [Potamilus streckersoni]|uniref:Smr domain-containing protein n=1 Tax=Potamilus streckersoni TaxID=2493646 RepID=A0AAE0S320_9BIVA|nr:hypothetical protein CHS0354_035249 [Potamilus streckersoni]